MENTKANSKYLNNIKKIKDLYLSVKSFLVVGFNLTYLGFKLSSKTSKNYLFYDFAAKLIDTTVSFILTLLLGTILNGLTSNQDKNSLFFYVLCYAIISMFNGFAETFLYNKSQYLQKFTSFTIFEIVLEKYRNIPVKYRNDKEFVEIERNLNVDGVITFINTSINIFFSIYQIVLVFIAITFFDANLILIAVIVGLVSFYFKLKNRILHFENRDIGRYQNSLVSLSQGNFKQNSLSSLDDNITINQNFEFLNKIYIQRLQVFKTFVTNYFKKVVKLENVSSYITDLATSLIFIIIYTKGIDGVFQIGTLTILVTNFSKLLSSFTSLANNITRVYSNFVEAKSVNDFFKYDIKNKETIKLAKKKNLILEFRDVCFTYPETDVPVLKNVSFKITKGDILGVLGENGSGKSTLIKLLYKIYIPTSGEVLLNGVNILEIDDVEYFSLIKCLSQEQGIENSLTVKEIIHLGNTSRKFELRNIKKAAKLASANDLIEKFNNKYEEFVSRNNLHLLNKYSETKYISLSPGQARRINLAKTFYSQKPIIILDEPTSNIDPTASNTIFSNFKKFQKREILVLVTHDVLRVNTVANKILILESGKIIEYGDKEELLKNGNSKYFSLINSIKKSLN